ncbi:prepilin-type N-terminal cleavage/methylation domain-containing protein [Paenisporosarcina quisquiliarum]|uniref:Prepilin-type N-terminal cleavage/methylation domain-containing protein n=1 Tax=Paenisporosarcina quisquiliarum TaxID=365346 RepID=A0A9X3RBZ6_9BACL|nr:prepilin-type N-terminal cleavage/methylation domain-containing protein [Paenisporosarcina quisquiliarum]MCZ8536175.1 prepilin-type N-terminal cleavage/methylation domain-containing protein [Paenisporosarcina quisquiliarum]
MKKFIQNKLKEQKGLTLIELLAVIVILAIIAAIAIPAIGNIIENSRNGAVKSDYQNALAAANVYFTENNSANGDTVTVGILAGKTMSGVTPTTSYLDDQGSLFDTVVIKKALGGNKISGSANPDNSVTRAGTGTATHTILAGGDGLTKSQISAIANSAFKGTSLGTAP